MNATPSSKDLEHLKLLSIFHYVLAGLFALGGCFPIIHLTVGLFFLLAPESTFEQPDGGGEEVPRFLIGGMFVGVALCVIIALWTLAVLTAIGGRHLAHQRRWTYCMVIAALMCLWVPAGTILGVFTILVLSRESVRERFGVAG